MYIDVRIPWEPGKRLGFACNRMFKTVDDWGLILDWDVTLLSLDWYDKCVAAIEAAGDNAGLISCMTNRIGCPLQKLALSGHVRNSDDLQIHYGISDTLPRGALIEDVTNSSHKLSGLFFLTRRGVWDAVGGVPDDKFIGMDNYYHDRVRAAGYRIFIIKNLYVFHGYRRVWK